jgi:Xaa-Pro aminopeptidase
MHVERRLEAVRAALEAAAVDALLVTGTVNVAYLTGFDGVFDSGYEDPHVCVVTPGGATLCTDSRYYDKASVAAAQGGEWEVVRITERLDAAVSDLLATLGCQRVAMEASVTQRRFADMVERWPGELVALDGVVENVRQAKEPEEIARIAAAQELTDRAFEHIVDFVRPGMSEWEIALELEFFMRREGSDGVAFPSIVASGPNSAYPHATVTERRVGPGDFLKLDFGARVDGYCSDMTRTVVIGTAREQHKAVYNAVAAANEVGIAAVRSGVKGTDVDRAARAVIEASGYGERFAHGLGHGVGMQVHELPGVGPRSSAQLVEGAVVTIEPGIYIPGFGGVRIEDLVVVERTGARVLTRSHKELLEL